MKLAGKKILLGVTGSIAAYKSVFLTRLLIKEGAEVKVVMTPSAKQFVGEVTFSTLTGHAVFSDLTSEGSWNSHVELGLWADVMLIAPTTAHTLAGMANGFADSLLLATYLSAKCPVWIAPAMDLDMWKHPATQNNIHQLQKFGHKIIEVEDGFLASGLHGKGRMAEPENIVSILSEQKSEREQDFRNKTLLLTAGPTHEPIDPVRFIGNRSSGKMGVALARAALERGAIVHLVHGPMAVSPPQDVHLKAYPVETASEMMEESKKLYPLCDGAILCAAVSDYRPLHFAAQKLKSSDQIREIQLEETEDIAAQLGKMKKPRQWLVGFALETENGHENARKKRKKKNFDFIVLNTTSDSDSPFGSDQNKVWIVKENNQVTVIDKSAKSKIAHDILDQVVSISK